MSYREIIDELTEEAIQTLTELFGEEGLLEQEDAALRAEFEASLRQELGAEQFIASHGEAAYQEMMDREVQRATRRLRREET